MLCSYMDTLVIALIVVGIPNDRVKHVRVMYSPDPPQLDEEIKIFISGTLSEMFVCSCFNIVTKLMA